MIETLESLFAEVSPYLLEDAQSLGIGNHNRLLALSSSFPLEEKAKNIRADYEKNKLKTKF